MTDQTAPNVTDADRRLARKWAESIESTTNSVESTTNPWSDRALAAARVILRDVPTPPPLPTLADMSPEERDACRFMHADVEMTPEERPTCGWTHADLKGDDSRVVILNHHEKDGLARVLWLCGCNKPFGWEKVTPRPDVARMEWPAGAPVSPNTLTVGSVWDDADALARACEETGRDQITVIDKRGIVGVWDTGLQFWRAYAPNADFAPFTILHAGRKADQ